MNLTQNVERAAKIIPDKTAIIFEDRMIQYGELNQLAGRLGSAMLAQGVKRGDRVALYLPNIPEFIVCYLATLKIGAIAVSVNPMLKSAELKYILNDCGAVMLFTVSELLPNIIREDYADLKHVVICEGAGAGNPACPDARRWICHGRQCLPNSRC